ncbi:MAG: hypothetical protein ACI9N3_002659 [Colwellia sp.]|jgi:hypothetical protein
MPAIALKRVDILKEGAGVVNFVTNKDVYGVKIDDSYHTNVSASVVK